MAVHFYWRPSEGKKKKKKEKKKKKKKKKKKSYFYYPPPPAEGVYASVCVFIKFYINLKYLIYKDIFHQICREYLCLCKHICAQFWPHIENKMAAIADCLKNIKMLYIVKYCS